MQTTTWGSSAWEYLHSITFNYPIKPTDIDKKKHLLYFKLVGELLPCNICRESYKLFTKYLHLKYYLADRNAITYWLFYIHNLVNLKLNNKLYKFVDVILKYENYRANLNNRKIVYDDIIESHNNTIMLYQDISHKRTLTMINENRTNKYIIALKENIHKK